MINRNLSRWFALYFNMTITLTQQTLKSALRAVNARQSQMLEQVFMIWASVEAIAKLIEIKLNMLAFHTMISALNKGFCIWNYGVQPFKHVLIRCKSLVAVEVFLSQRFAERAVIIRFYSRKFCNVFLCKFADGHTIISNAKAFVEGTYHGMERKHDLHFWSTSTTLFAMIWRADIGII